MTIMYMHKICGKPAIFQGGQIVYAGMQINFSDLRTSLKDIRIEQIKSSEWRKSKGFDEHPQDYGYLRIKMD